MCVHRTKIVRYLNLLENVYGMEIDKSLPFSSPIKTTLTFSTQMYNVIFKLYKLNKYHAIIENKAHLLVKT